jgi:hypothetical protein
MRSRRDLDAISRRRLAVALPPPRINLEQSS